MDIFTRYAIRTFIVCLFFIQPLYLSATTWIERGNSEELLGVWLTQKQDSKVQIFRHSNGSFFGKIVWAKSPNESYEGIEVMRDVTYNDKNGTYTCPWIHTPRLNITAKATFSVEVDVLNIKITKGIVVVHQVFTRVK